MHMHAYVLCTAIAQEESDQHEPHLCHLQIFQWLVDVPTL